MSSGTRPCSAPRVPPPRPWLFSGRVGMVRRFCQGQSDAQTFLANPLTMNRKWGTSHRQKGLLELVAAYSQRHKP